MQLSPFLMCFPYHRSPLQGTHGDRVAGDNTRSRHNQRHFSYYATSPAWQLRNRTPRILVLFVKSDARYGRRLAAPTGKTGGTRIDRYRPLVMPLRLRGGLRNTVPRILVQSSCSALISAFALRTLTSNKHIPLISTLRIGDVLFKFSARLEEQKSSK